MCDLGTLVQETVVSWRKCKSQEENHFQWQEENSFDINYISYIIYLNFLPAIEGIIGSVLLC